MIAEGLSDLGKSSIAEFTSKGRHKQSGIAFSTIKPNCGCALCRATTRGTLDFARVPRLFFTTVMGVGPGARFSNGATRYWPTSFILITILLL